MPILHSPEWWRDSWILGLFPPKTANKLFTFFQPAILGYFGFKTAVVPLLLAMNLFFYPFFKFQNKTKGMSQVNMIFQGLIIFRYLWGIDFMEGRFLHWGNLIRFVLLALSIFLFFEFYHFWKYGKFKTNSIYIDVIYSLHVFLSPGFIFANIMEILYQDF